MDPGPMMRRHLTGTHEPSYGRSRETSHGTGPTGPFTVVRRLMKGLIGTHVGPHELPRDVARGSVRRLMGAREASWADS